MFDTIWTDPEALGQVVGAIIGVVGLFVGTFITIFTSLIIRQMDVRREERREKASLDRAKKEQAFSLKQEIYTQFISELASIENFISKKASDLDLTTLETFDNEWTRIEIKVDLVASADVIKFKNELSDELINLAKKKFSQKDASQEVKLSDSYTENRSELLEAIRQDMEIITQNI
jgi:hypothetical protein